MRILIVSHEYNVGGSTRSMINLTLELMKRGIDVNILIPRKKTAAELLDKYGLKYDVVRYYPNYKHIDKSWKLYEIFHEFMNYWHVIGVAKYIKKNKYDYVISNSSAVDVAARACKHLKQKHIYYIREIMGQSIDLDFCNKTRMKKLIENSEGTIFISNAVRDAHLKNYSISNYVQIYNGIDARDYDAPGHSILDCDDIKFVQIGAICESKGTLSTIKMIERVRKICKCQLTIVGDIKTDYYKVVKKYVDDNELNKNVEFVGYQENVSDFLSQSDILIMNTKYEGLGRVTIEGMISGCLVIGRASGGTLEIINHNVNGLLFENEDEFIYYIKDILEKKDFYKQMARAARDYAISKFSIEQCARKAINYLESIG